MRSMRGSAAGRCSGAGTSVSARATAPVPATASTHGTRICLRSRAQRDPAARAIGCTDHAVRRQLHAHLAQRHAPGHSVWRRPRHLELRLGVDQRTRPLRVHEHVVRAGQHVRQQQRDPGTDRPRRIAHVLLSRLRHARRMPNQPRSGSRLRRAPTKSASLRAFGLADRGGADQSMPPMPPMPPPPWACGSSFFGSSAMASVVIIRPAIEAAFCSAERVTCRAGYRTRSCRRTRRSRRYAPKLPLPSLTALSHARLFAAVGDDLAQQGFHRARAIWMPWFGLRWRPSGRRWSAARAPAPPPPAPAFLHRRTRNVQGVFDARLLFLHLDLGRGTDLDHRHAAGQQPRAPAASRGRSRRGLFDLRLDL